MPKILRVLVAASVLKGAVAVAAAPLSRDPAPAPPPPATVETLPAEMDFYEDT
jgi:hypothetical protein